jgi:uncharacterized RDD family membrane protein YckC
MTTGPEAGYYADPSIPGYIRYWDGSQWVPGTSQPAPDFWHEQAQTHEQVLAQEPVPAHQPGNMQAQSAQIPSAVSAYEYDQAALQQSVAAQLTQTHAQTQAQAQAQALAQAPAHTPDQASAATDAAVAQDQVPDSVGAMVVPSAFAARGSYGSGSSGGSSGSPFDAIPGLYRAPAAQEAVESEVRVVELASAGSRILARIIDFCIAVVLSLPVTVTLLLVAHRHDHAYVDQLRLHAKTTYRTLGMDALGIALWAGALAVVLLTAVVFEAYRLPRTGQTTGRRLVGVQVVTAGNALEPSGGAAGARALMFWLFALIPVVDVLALGGILWGRPYRQGLHEKLSGTLSIRA